MGETKNELTSEKSSGSKEVKTSKSSKKDVQKRSKFADLKAEFKKIIWPDKDTLVKQTTAVVAISFVLGVIIACMDFIIQYGVDFLVKL